MTHFNMAADDLPKKFDVIVLGTGFLESVLAAAFARVGYSVLHIDRNDYYCGDWAAFNLQGVDRWAKEQQGSHHDPIQRPDSPELQEGDVLVECPLYGNTNFNIDTDFVVRPEEEDETDSEKNTAVCEQSVSVSESDPSISSCVSKGEHLSPVPGEVIQEANSGTVQESHTNKNKSLEGDGTDISSLCENKLKLEIDTSRSETDRNNSVTDNNESAKSKVDSEQGEDFKKETDVDVESSKDNIEHAISKVDNNSDDKCDKEVVQSPDTNCDTETLKPWTRTSVEKEWRKFNIDLAPRLLYCRGEMVELLIDSDVSKYCEFKTVTRVLTLLEDTLQQVPCSRADVFSSKSVSMIEKRMMMKFLMFSMDYQKHPEEYTDYKEKTFAEFLDSRKLKPNIRHFIQHSIAMATDKTTTLEGLEKTQKFILSLGRYGNTAFLWPLYGSGELPQSFARMCAVFAGIYCLRMTASSIIVDKDNKYRGIVTSEGHRVESRWLISEVSYLPSHYLHTEESNRVISRAVLMTNKSIHSSESEELTLLHLPCPDDPTRPVVVLELPPSSMASPKGLYLVHLTREGHGDCKPLDDLQYTVDTLFTTNTDQSSSDSRPSVLWYMYFSQSNSTDVRLSEDCPEGVTVIPGPGTELDMDHVVKQAKEIFGRLLPDEEFLPKAPNPEDIIYDDGQNTQTGEGFNPSEADGESPTEQTPGQSPTEQTTGGKSPAEQMAVGDSPTEKRTAGESPTEQTVESNPSCEQISDGNSPTKQISCGESPREQGQGDVQTVNTDIAGENLTNVTSLKSFEN